MKSALIAVAVLACVATYAYAQNKPSGTPGRFVAITPPAAGLHAIYRVDTATGAVSYCFAVSNQPTPKDGSLTPADYVRCVGQN